MRLLALLLRDDVGDGIGRHLSRRRQEEVEMKQQQQQQQQLETAGEEVEEESWTFWPWTDT